MILSTTRRILLNMCLICLLMAVLQPSDFQPASAETTNGWWHDDWPYRVQVITNKSGPVSVNLNFTQLFSELGLQDALLDPSSLRVVPYKNGQPQPPVPFQETYTTLFLDADTLNQDGISPDPYWTKDADWVLALDNDQHTQGTGSVHAQVMITNFSPPDPWFKYNFNESGGVNWSNDELLLYDIRAQVNDSAIDQTPDIYHFELGGLKTCPITKINGPALVMDTWNTAIVSLKPFGNCPSPDLSDLDYLRFYVTVKSETENYGYFEKQDELELWLDNFRLLDQDGPGEIRWETDSSIDSYYIYFDTINHTGHPEPVTISVSEPTLSVSSEAPEAGGYFFNIINATTGDLSIWASPTAEKIFQTAKPPVTNKNLSIFGAKGEFEPFQLVVRAPTNREISLSASNLTHSNGTSMIAADNIEFFRVDYVNITQLSDFYGRTVLWPDPLYPISPNLPVTFSAGVNQPIWVRVHIPTSTDSGIYTGHISIGSATIPYSLTVWNFLLPTEHYLKNYFGFDWDLVMKTYGGAVDSLPTECFEKLEATITATLSNYGITVYNEEIPPDDVSEYLLTAYEVTKAHNEQLIDGKRVWWRFSPIDHPPHINPAVMDRPGIEGRLLPWLAWLDRVDGLSYPQSVDWNPDPWSNPFSNGMNNGDGFLFYPPKEDDDSLGFDPCVAQSNRLVPSIRLELLREGLEDYAYFWLLNRGKPSINQENTADLLARSVVSSRTLISRIPTLYDPIRQAIAAELEARQHYQYLPLVIH